MTTLYVTQQGASIRRVSQRIQVCRAGQVLETARIRDMERLVLLGNIDLTAAALTAPRRGVRSLMTSLSLTAIPAATPTPALMYRAGC